MRKLLISILLTLLCSSFSPAAELRQVRFSATREKVRLVFDLSKTAEYNLITAEGELKIEVLDSSTTLESLEINDPALSQLKLNSGDNTIQALIQIKQPVKVKIFPLAEPARIVVDLQRLAAAAPAKPKPYWSRLKSIAVSKSKSKVRAVLSFSRKPWDFNLISTEAYVKLEFSYLLSTVSQKRVKDSLLDYIYVNRRGGKKDVVFPLKEETSARIFELDHPYRIVVDLPREYEISSSEYFLGALEHIRIKKKTLAGPVEINLLILNQEVCEVIPVFAQSEKIPDKNLVEQFFSFLGGQPPPWDPFVKKSVKSLVGEIKGIAGINGAYFSPGGRPLGILMRDGKIISSPLYNRSALIIKNNGEAEISNLDLRGFVNSAREIRLKFDAINEPITHNEIVLYTPEHGKTPPEKVGTDIVISNNKVVDIRDGDSKIPEDGYALRAHGEAGCVLREKFKIGDWIGIEFNFIPNLSDVKQIIGGGPRLVKNGQIYVTAKAENFRSDIWKGRAARTGVGILKNGNLLLATVDGLPRRQAGLPRRNAKKSDKSIGMTLTEFARFLKDHGAQEALNLDGGSSTTMVVNERLVNATTGGNFQKPVGNALVVKLK